MLIVEDELIIAEDMADILRSHHYQVCGIATNFMKALHLAQTEKPDIVIIDIKLTGEKDGIHLAEEIRANYKIPFIFASSHSDRETIDRAKKVNPYGYLIKPFQEDDISVALELALSNYSKENRPSEEPDNFILNDSLFIRYQSLIQKIPFDELLYVRAEGNYSHIYTSSKNYVLRSTLKEVEDKLPGNIFFRVHKSYLINLKHLKALDADYVLIKDERLPVGRAQHQELMQKLNKL